MNYYPQRDGQIAELDDESTTSSELLQAHLPESPRWSRRSTTSSSSTCAALARPGRRRGPQRPAPSPATTQAAKQVVSELLDAIGYDTVDLGPLAEGWRTQPDTAAYGIMYAVNPQAWDQGARPAPAAVVARAGGGVASAPGRPGLTPAVSRAGLVRTPVRALSGAATASSVDRDGSAVGALPRSKEPVVYARTTTMQADPARIDAGIAYVRDQVFPAVTAMDGCVGMSMLVDRESGRCIATTAWESEAALRDSAERVRPLRDGAERALGSSTAATSTAGRSRSSTATTPCPTAPAPGSPG